MCNVCQLHRFFGDDYEDIWDGERTARTGCVDTKKLLADRIIRHYAPARERYAELMASPAEIDGILEAGADRLRAEGRGHDGRGPLRRWASASTHRRRSRPGAARPRGVEGLPARMSDTSRDV